MLVLWFSCFLLFMYLLSSLISVCIASTALSFMFLLFFNIAPIRRQHSVCPSISRVSCVIIVQVVGVHLVRVVLTAD